MSDIREFPMQPPSLQVVPLERESAGEYVVGLQAIYAHLGLRIAQAIIEVCAPKDESN